jgi:hypothetical protein
VSRGAFVGGVAAGLIAAATFSGVGERPDEEQPEPEVITVTETETVTETVEREVFTWPDECERYVRLVDSVWHEIDAYEDGVAPQQQILYDTLGAMIAQDNDRINKAITAQNEVLNATAGPLAEIIDAQPDIAEARDACLARQEESHG